VRLAVEGDSLRPRPDETPVVLSKRIQAEVARLLDEDETDWWSSLRRAAADAPPAAAAPPATSWCRTWASTRPGEPPIRPGASVSGPTPDAEGQGRVLR